MGKTVFIFDIDGTLADATRRYKRAGKEPSRRSKITYDKWVTRVQNERTLMQDPPVKGMVEFVNSFPKNDIRYVTGREHKWHWITREWLNKNGFNFSLIHFRRDGDYRSSGKVKEEHIKHILALGLFTNVVVIDDDPKGDIEKMCKRNNFTFLKAKSGS